MLPYGDRCYVTIQLRYTDFIQKCFRLDGAPWRLENRPYIYPIINSKYKRTLMLAARQVEKSTTMAGKVLSKACMNANKSFLYLTPTMKQTGVFSRKKIDEVFETSPLLRKNFYPGVKGFRVEEKRLKNFATLYFRSAFRDADSIRGISISGEIYFDELQDCVIEVVPVIEACAQKFKDAQFSYSGTPKTLDNTLEQYWQLSNQCEWHVKCMGCGHWNMLGIDNVLLDKPGIWCTKCQKELNVLEGVWVNATDADMFGVRMPGIILHKDYVDWKELFFKIRNWGTAELMNEVFGQSYDHGAKPLSRDQLITACDNERSIWSAIPHQFTGNQFYAGIDWGGGNDKVTKKPSYTILTIGYFCAFTQKFKVVFVKRFMGKEAEPDNLIPALAKLIMDFRATIVGADFGYGFGMNDQLRRALPSVFTYVTFRHSIIRKFLAYDEAGNTYVTNRTETMTELFNRIKMGTVEFYKWQEFEDIGKDYLAIGSEFSETLRQMRYIHTQPDDAFHSGLYALLTWMRHTNQIPITRYDPNSDDIDARVESMMK